jgi:hypothetical protein
MSLAIIRHVIRKFKAQVSSALTLASSVGSQLGVLEGLALHELWLEPVDGVQELQGSERCPFLPAFEQLQAGFDLAMRLRGRPLGLLLRRLGVGAQLAVILADIIRVTNVT